MPLSAIGKKVKKRIIQEYGAKKGTRIFYAMEHTHPKWKAKRRRIKRKRV